MRIYHLLFLLTILILDAAFLAIPDLLGSKGTVGFILSDVKLQPATWMYMFNIKLIAIMFAYSLWMEAKVYKNALKSLFYILVFHGLEYILHYSSVWGTYEEGTEFKFTTRLITICIFSYYILKEILKDKEEA